MKKTVAFLLSAILFGSTAVAPLSANAQTADNDSAKNISSSMEDNSGCSIEDSYMRGNTVTVVGKASEKCKIVAAIYSEATNDMYTSGYADVNGSSGEQFSVDIVLNTERMPKFCVLKIFVLGSDNSPLLDSRMMLSYSKELYDSEDIIRRHGQCGKNVYYDLYVDGLLYIYGKGEMDDYYFYDYDKKAPFSDTPEVKQIIIDEGVTYVGRDSFKQCTEVTSVVIPDSLKEIGSDAFSKCSSLTNIYIPKGVQKIAKDAFDSNEKLSDINVDSGNTYFSSYNGALFDKDKTTLLLCPDGKSGSFTVPESVSKINDGAFKQCANLTHIELSDKVTAIPHNAFCGCKSLVSVKMPPVITEIGDYAFGYCSSLSSIDIPHGVETVGEGAFSGCSSLTDVVLPEGVKTVGSSAFKGCTNLKNIKFSNGITSIGSHVMDSCISLTSVELPYGVTEIGDYAFVDCSNLVSVKIPESVVSLGSGAFRDCDKLTSVNLLGGITKIGCNTFDGCKSLNSINIPSSVVSIEDRAFMSCESLTSVVLPSGLTTIGNTAFGNCSKLVSINIPDTVTYIGEYAFHDCVNLTTGVVIPSGVTQLNQYAFLKCEKLSGVVLRNGITDIGKGAFMGCRSVKSVEIPASVKAISEGAFWSCDSLTTIKFIGNKPAMQRDTFYFVASSNLTVYYPQNNATWNNVASEFDQQEACKVKFVPYAPAASGETSYNISDISQDVQNVTVEQCLDKKNTVCDITSEVKYRPDNQDNYGTVDFSKLVPNEKYIVVVVKDENARNLFDPENLVYIDQINADSEGRITINRSDFYKTFSGDVNVLAFGAGIASDTETVIMGDINGDGKVTSFDSLLGQRMMLRLIPMSEKNLIVGDIDKDGRITISDCVEILRYAVHYAVDSNVGQEVTINKEIT